MKTRIVNIAYDERGNILVTLNIPRKHKAELENFKDIDLECKLTKFRKKRSLNANDYLWVLADKIAEAVNLTKEDVYRDAIKNVGIYRDFHSLPEAEANTLSHIWNSYGTGWIAEKVDFEADGESIMLRCYYGSSCYNTKQMSRLIDYIVNEARNLDIETATPDELLDMKSKWKGFEKC